MENQRLLLFLALSLVILLIWEAWQDKNTPVTPTVATVSSGETTPLAVPADKSAPTTPSDLPTAVAMEEPAQPAEAADNANMDRGSLATQKRIRVVTDVLDVDIDTLGGDLRRAYLPTYPVSQDTPNKPYPLMGDELPQLFVAQSGLLSQQGGPDHHAMYQVDQDQFVLNDGEDTVTVALRWTDGNGLEVIKQYTFTRGSYLIKLDHIVKNNAGAEWKGRLYRQFQRSEYDEPGKSRLLYTFTGGAVSTPEIPYSKIDFDEFAEWKAEQSYTTGGWVAMLQHYFVTAWIPKSDEVNNIYTRNYNDTRYILGMTGKEVSVQPGQQQVLDTQLYIGPKLQHVLEEIEPNLKLAVDYGILSIIAQPLFWLLEKLHQLTQNWGWSIILLTLIIKLVFYKLSEASYRSMANMRQLAPKFQAIRDRYGDDRQRMTQATMELYKKEKVNPMSGCWPMLVQIPVFISLYWVLLESVEMRQAPFILWITDLSTKDPYFVLPILMGISMYIQQKLSDNPSMDPMHRKIMQFLPIVFTLFFMLFPAGLVLYWVVNSVLSILQQWYIMRKIEKATA
ncbi:MAG: membrane protein insertase YidC [Gammaproteobacteria bacterium]|nr:membrane protein insertase YidC [Gammaproteobacteria bacterium]